MLSTVTSFLFFLGLLAFFADLGGEAATATALNCSPDWRQESAVAAHTNSTTMASEHEKCNECTRVHNSPPQAHAIGIPKYSVEIVNECGRCVYNVALNCGQFHSANVIPLTVLRHIAGDVCIVNDGGLISSGVAFSFEYFTTMPYPFTLHSVQCDL